MVGFGWFPLKPGEPPDPDAFLAGAAALRTFVEEVPNHYPVDRDRLVLLGFSQGGAMAYDLGLRHPEQVAGIAAMASWLPHKLAATIPKQPRHTGLPVLVLHGTRDPMVDVERARESREALRPFGVSLTYRELDMEHEISREALQLLVRWLDERVGGAGQIDGETPQG
jgi:phospholipase/carboxylesterase